jgi:hypothetical protein
MIDSMELDKSSEIKIKIMENGINTNPINITSQKYANPIEVRISLDVSTKTMEIPSISANQHLRINKETQVCKEDILPKVKPESTTNIVSKVHVTKNPYRHPNHKSQYFHQLVYQHCLEQRLFKLYSEEY